MIPVPEMGRSRWGEGLAADDTKKCVWVIRRPSMITNMLGLQSSGGPPYRRDRQHYGYLS